METIRISRNWIGKKALAKAVTTLRNGGVVAYPTETAYGLAADPRDRDAVRRIYKMKGRSPEKALPLICGSTAMAGRLVRLPSMVRRLALATWPGAFTVVAPLSAVWKKRIVSSRNGTVAARVPALAVPRAISDALGAPIISTSANRSGDAPSYSGTAVRKAFRDAADAPDIILDAGVLPRRPPSTIVALKHGKIEVLRQGKVRVQRSEGIKM